MSSKIKVMDNIPSVLDVPVPRNGVYHLLGLCVLLASKLRSRLGGSVKARTFPMEILTMMLCATKG